MVTTAPAHPGPTLFVQGLRPAWHGPYPWQRVLRDRLTHAYTLLTPSDATKEAEDGLGYKPSAYWYVHRCEPAFGRVAVTWTAGATALPSPAAQCTPFDTGGVWGRRIAVHPEFTGIPDLVSFVHGAAVEAGQIENKFTSWMAVCYAQKMDYQHGKPPIAYTSRIVMDDKVNKPRAWTWEFRIEAAKIQSDVIAPVAIYWPERDYEDFERWIGVSDDRLSAREQAGLLTRCRAMSHFSNSPAADLQRDLST